jgi:hypothetical protein
MSDNQDCHYIGIDVGTGSVRACIIDDTGEIKGLASEDIGLWQPEHGFYVCIHQPDRDLTLTADLGTINKRHLGLHLQVGAQCPERTTN